MLAGLAWQLCVAAVPVVLGRTVDAGIVAGERSALWRGAGLLVVLGVATALTDALRHRWETLSSARVQVDLRERVAAAALAADEARRDEWPASELLARATGDADQVAEAAEASAWVVAQAVVIPVVVALLLGIDLVLGLAVVATVGLAVLATWRASAAWEHRTEAAQEAMAAYVAEVHDVLEGVKVIRGVGGEEGAQRGVDRRSLEVRERTTHTARLWVVFGPVVEVLAGVAAVAVLWVGGERAISGALGIGDVVAAAGLAVVLAEPVGSVGYGVVALRQAGVAARRLTEALGEVTPGVVAGAGDGVGADGVSFAYPSRPERLVLDGVSVRADAGEVVLVDGPVASGKSTLLAVLAGDRRPQQGSVELPASVLRLGPEPFLLADTVAANLRLGAPDATDDELLDALDAAGIAIELDTVLADRGASLSGGQRQRLALARAVLAAPHALLLDGALSGLEPALELAVLDTVRRRWAGGVVVLVSANPGAPALADRVVAL